MSATMGLLVLGGRVVCGACLLFVAESGGDSLRAFVLPAGPPPAVEFIFPARKN
jgi:hypothetical protein